jgi:hypothetical protein
MPRNAKERQGTPRNAKERQGAPRSAKERQRISGQILTYLDPKRVKIGAKVAKMSNFGQIPRNAKYFSPLENNVIKN